MGLSLNLPTRVRSIAGCDFFQFRIQFFCDRLLDLPIRGSFRIGAMTYKIYFPDWNRSADVLEGENVLDSSLRSKIDLSYSCRSGRCGACKILLLKGEVEHLSHNRFALTEEEKENGLILACRSVPKSDLSLRRIDTQSN